MPDGSDSIAIAVHPRIADIPWAQWDACAGDNPFVSHAFLDALEQSGSACARTGWQPQHLTIADGSGRIAGAVPLYLKSHSYGEYIFDWGWADAYHRAGGSYYPKLQACVPFTPATGARLLLRPDCDQKTVRNALIAGMLELTQRHNASSLHITFPTREQWQQLGDAGLLKRIGLQYHWQNRGYSSFDDFLADLASRKRKAIKKERRKVADSGIVLKALSGDDITALHWDKFYNFYLDTSDKKWGQAYLTREFFDRIGSSLSGKTVLMIAEDDGEIVAGALNLKSNDTLYGRNWGCHGNYRFLHFEACYYQAIDYAIEHGLKFVEAGAQGEHKIQRGYLPVEIYSAHWIRDAGFSDAIADFLQRETRSVKRDIEMLSEGSPFKNE